MIAIVLLLNVVSWLNVLTDLIWVHKMTFQYMYAFWVWISFKNVTIAWPTSKTITSIVLIEIESPLIENKRRYKQLIRNKKSTKQSCWSKKLRKKKKTDWFAYLSVVFASLALRFKSGYAKCHWPDLNEPIGKFGWDPGEPKSTIMA